jgi:alginate O-acetyltransferase complex protein AlgJ
MSERSQWPEPQAAAVPGRALPHAMTERPRRPSQVYRKLAHEPRRTTQARDVALIACFLIAVSLPLAGLVLSLDSAFLLDENRVLASRPALKLSAAQLAAYPTKFDAYFNDQFGFRKRLIHLLNYAKVAGLGVSPTPKVILGRNDWLFYGDIDIPYYRAVKRFTPRELDAWQKPLEQRQRWLADRGIPYLIVFAPLKGTVYPEFLPGAYNRVDTVSRLDQLMTHLKEHSKLNVVDLRKSILDEKSRHQVFYRTDTHWNNRGAYAGYIEIAKALRRWLPELEPVPRSAFEEFQYSGTRRDLPLLLGMQPYFWERYVDFKTIKPALAHEVKPPPPSGKLPARDADIVYEQSDKRLPRAVMFRDSYATWLIPLLSENFSHIRYSWQYTVDYEIVERERPDIVIQEMVERVLMEPRAPSP